MLLALLAAAILVAIDSLPGAFIGGLLVDIAENLPPPQVSPGYKPAMSFLLLLAVLVLRPQGLGGEWERGAVTDTSARRNRVAAGRKAMRWSPGD